MVLSSELLEFAEFDESLDVTCQICDRTWRFDALDGILAAGSNDFVCSACQQEGQLLLNFEFLEQ